MRYYIGVELGVNNINIAIVDRYGKLIKRNTFPTLKDRPYQDIIKDVATEIKLIIENEDIDIKNIKYIGVGCPGIPNNKDGTIVRNYTLNFVNTPIREELQKYFNLPIYVENDANCAALAESISGAAEEIDFSIMIRIGTGIGGGIILNNKIYNGFNFAAGELGHMVISMDGEQCTCGRKGCWEAYASGTALIKQTMVAAVNHPESLINNVIENDLTKISVTTAFEAAKLGDNFAKDVVKQYISYLGEGIINLINILMPQAIIFGGDISKLGEPFLKLLREYVDEGIYSKDIEKPEFKMAELGSAAIVIGAAMLGINRDNLEI